MRAAVRLVASLVVAAAVLSGPPGPGSGRGLAPARAFAADWKAEFDDVCAKAQDAMTLPTAELKTLVSRCDALKPMIEALEESQRKVYARRLQTCRNLYQFVLDYRQQQGNG